MLIFLLGPNRQNNQVQLNNIQFVIVCLDSMSNDTLLLNSKTVFYYFELIVCHLGNEHLENA